MSSCKISIWIAAIAAAVIAQLVELELCNHSVCLTLGQTDVVVHIHWDKIRELISFVTRLLAIRGFFD